MREASTKCTAYFSASGAASDLVLKKRAVVSLWTFCNGAFQCLYARLVP